MAARMNRYRLLVGKPEGKRQLGTLRQVSAQYLHGSWRDRGGITDWNGLDKDRDKAINLRFHKMMGGSRATAQPVASQVVLNSIS
jgi:hypothetical protein